MTNNKTPPPLLTPQEAAHFLNVCVSTLANWRALKTHPLPYINMGRRIRYRIKDLDNFINGKAPKDQDDVSIITQYDISALDMANKLEREFCTCGCYGGITK